MSECYGLPGLRNIALLNSKCPSQIQWSLPMYYDIRHVLNKMVLPDRQYPKFFLLGLFLHRTLIVSLLFMFFLCALKLLHIKILVCANCGILQMQIMRSRLHLAWKYSTTSVSVEIASNISIPWPIGIQRDFRRFLDTFIVLAFSTSGLW